MIFKALFKSLYPLYLYLKLILHIAWIQLNRNWRPNPKTSLGEKKILILGGDLALGCGDWIRLGQTAGITRFLEPGLRSLDSIRAYWRVYNLGIHRGGVLQWTPGSPPLERVFKQFSDADVVIVALDLPSPQIDPLVVKMALKDTLAALERDRQIVFIVPPTPIIAHFASVSPQQGDARLLKQTRAFQRVFQEIANQHAIVYADQWIPPARRDFFCWDQVHPNSKGYRALAKGILEVVQNMCVKVEFQQWKGRLE